uniref:enhancer of filamentation 1-like n=1 Tax=Styela clava TaxID=7725 RepID=UPI0019395255|nr:enhancer of filamentation 1-like [Styela clava]
MTAGNILAKALYDNLAETEDELNFHRGDIVTVIEQNTAGIDGWWLCSLNGRKGIAPGNRLRLMPLMQGISQQTVLEKPLINVEDEEYDIPTHQYYNQNNNNNDPNDVYDVPVSRHFGSRPELDLDPDEVYDVPPVHATLHTSNIQLSNENLLTSSPQHRTVTIEQEVYDVPSNLIAPANISNITSEYDPSEIYDVPPNRSLEPEEVYDVPVSNKMSGPEPLDVSAMLVQQEEDEEEYDIPPSRPFGQDTVDSGLIPMYQASTPSSKVVSSDRLDSPDLIYDVPSSNRSAGDVTDGSLNLSSVSTSSKFHPGNRSLLKQESEDYVYDVPPRITREPLSTSQQTENESLDLVIKRLSLVGSAEYKNDRKSTSSSDSLSSIIAANANYTELNLELSSAIDQLIKLKQSLEDSVSVLLTHVYEGWRLKENISGKIGVIKGVFEVVLSAVGQYVEFARGAMANANAAQQRGLSVTLPRALITGMHKLLQPLEEDNLMLQQAFTALDQAYWSLGKVVSNDPDFGVPDEIDSFVMTSRAVSDDARQIAAFIHTHSQYLFKKVETRPPTAFENYKAQQIIQTRPLPDLPPQKLRSPTTIITRPDEDSWLEDYDYVALDDQGQTIQDGTFNNSNSSVINEVSIKVKTRHIEVLQVLEMSNKQHGVPKIINGKTSTNNSITNDQFTLQDMVEDLPILVESLVSAIKGFYSCLDNNDPPKTFVALSKQVILCAHELVFFGDTLYRRLHHQQMQDIVKGHCTEICTSLKRTVAATKNAAQQWPSVNAVQEMIDRVTDISASAHQFRILLSQCSVR